MDPWDLDPIGRDILMPLDMTLPLLSLRTPAETGRELGARVRALRLAQDLTRETLADRAGVSPSSLKRFETTGAASLDLVLRIAFSLGRMEDFQGVLQPAEATTLDELRARSARPPRQRGRR